MLSDKFKSYRSFFDGMGLSSEDSITETIHALEQEMNNDPVAQATFYKGPAGTYIPMRMLNPIKAYLDQGLYPGSFLEAVLTGDLVGAILHADDENIKNIPAFVDYFYNMASPDAWGSKEKVNAWIRSSGLMGRGDL
jgi:hypothetical protein